MIPILVGLILIFFMIKLELSLNKVRTIKKDAEDISQGILYLNDLKLLRPLI